MDCRAPVNFTVEFVLESFGLRGVERKRQTLLLLRISAPMSACGKKALSALIGP